MSDVDHIKDELTRLTSVVMTARKLLAGVARLDLAVLEERVVRLCEDMAALPEGEGAKVLDDAKVLINRLDALETELREHLDRLGREMGE